MCRCVKAGRWIQIISKEVNNVMCGVMLYQLEVFYFSYSTKKCQ